MITLTNDYNIPFPIVAWLMNDDYEYNSDPKTFSATELIKPTKKAVLSSAVARSKTINVPLDVSKKRASVRGQNIHSAIEEAYAKQGHLNRIANQLHMRIPEVMMEQRLTAQVEVEGEVYTVSGKFDALVDGVVNDWKTESVYAFNDETKAEERRLQLSIYAWLCQKNDIECNLKVGQFVSLFQDWSEKLAEKAKDKTKYPQTPILEVPLKLHSLDFVSAWIKERIIERTQISINDLDQVECTNEELWMKDRVIQYFSNPQAAPDAKAQKNFEGENQVTESANWLNSKGKGILRDKPQFAKACEYCFGAHICSQYKRLLKSGNIENASTTIPVPSTI